MLMKYNLQDQFINTWTGAISMYNSYKNTFTSYLEDINKSPIFIDLKVNMIKLIELLPKDKVQELRTDLNRAQLFITLEKSIRKRYRRFLIKIANEVDATNTNEELQLLLYKNLLILDIGFVYLNDSLLRILVG